MYMYIPYVSLSFTAGPSYMYMHPPSWHPDPQAPFQTPSHLREAVQEFERSQVPNIGLRPNSVPPAGDSVPPQDQQTSEDLEFIYSYVCMYNIQCRNMYMYVYSVEIVGQALQLFKPSELSRFEEGENKFQV